MLRKCLQKPLDRYHYSGVPESSALGIESPSAPNGNVSLLGRKMLPSDLPTQSNPFAISTKLLISVLDGGGAEKFCGMDVENCSFAGVMGLLPCEY